MTKNCLNNYTTTLSKAIINIDNYKKMLGGHSNTNINGSEFKKVDIKVLDKKKKQLNAELDKIKQNCMESINNSEKKTEDCIKTMNNIKITEKEEHIKKFNSIMQQKINCEEKLQLLKNIYNPQDNKDTEINTKEIIEYFTNYCSDELETYEEKTLLGGITRKIEKFIGGGITSQIKKNYIISYNNELKKFKKQMKGGAGPIPITITIIKMFFIALWPVLGDIWPLGIIVAFYAIYVEYSMLEVMNVDLSSGAITMIFACLCPCCWLIFRSIAGWSNDVYQSAGFFTVVSNCSDSFGMQILKYIGNDCKGEDCFSMHNECKKVIFETKL